MYPQRQTLDENTLRDALAQQELGGDQDKPVTKETAAYVIEKVDHAFTGLEHNPATEFLHDDANERYPRVNSVAESATGKTMSLVEVGEAAKLATIAQVAEAAKAEQYMEVTFFLEQAKENEIARQKAFANRWDDLEAEGRTKGLPYTEVLTMPLPEQKQWHIELEVMYAAIGIRHSTNRLKKIVPALQFAQSRAQLRI